LVHPPPSRLAKIYKLLISASNSCRVGARSSGCENMTVSNWMSRFWKKFWALNFELWNFELWNFEGKLSFCSSKHFDRCINLFGWSVKKNYRSIDRDISFYFLKLSTDLSTKKLSITRSNIKTHFTSKHFCEHRIRKKYFVTWTVLVYVKHNT